MIRAAWTRVFRYVDSTDTRLSEVSPKEIPEVLVRNVSRKGWQTLLRYGGVARLARWKE